MTAGFRVEICADFENQAQGLTFASVHDSYWTHAGDIDKMSAIIRDTFIALHSSDVLNKLHEEVCYCESELISTVWLTPE